MISKINKHFNVDWLLIFLMTVMTSVGILLISTATKTHHYWVKQVLFFSFSFIILLFFSLIKSSFWYKISFYLYGLGISLLVFILVFSNGVERWIKLPFGLYFQPSEMIKISLVLVLARVLSKNPIKFSSFRSYIMPCSLFFVPFLLVLKQPDLSTAIVILIIFISMLHFSGIKIKQLFILLSPCFSVLLIFNQYIWILFFISLLLLMWFCRMKFFSIIIFSGINIMSGYISLIIWSNLLKPYQKDRISTFWNPFIDPHGGGYQIIQSKITIGSGGIFGKGLGAGSQTNLGFLPEEHTDFIFSVLAEQFGFVGSIILLGLFVLFNYRILKILEKVLDPFASLVIVGLLVFFIFHMFFNVAMTLGLIPVTGLPLPFISYGGSFLLTCFIAISLIFSMNKKV